MVFTDESSGFVKKANNMVYSRAIERERELQADLNVDGDYVDGGAWISSLKSEPWLRSFFRES